MNTSPARRIQIVKSLMRDRYEPGRQDRNKTFVFRTEVFPLLGISKRTFSRYINTSDEDVSKAMRPKEDPRQGSLFPDFF